MNIEVTQADIANGIPQTDKRHPLQLAVARHFGQDYCTSSFDGNSLLMVIQNPKRSYPSHITHWIHLDKDLRDYRGNFDRVDLSHWKERRPHPLRKPTPPITIKLYPDPYPHNDDSVHHRARITGVTPTPPRT